MSQTATSYSPALPDFKWINAEVPILEVARALSIKLYNKRTTCEDCGKKKRMTFSVRFNGWKCWSCEPGGHMHSVLDLVSKYRGCSVYDAARWINEHWNVAGRIQVEKTDSERGTSRRQFVRYRAIPVPDCMRPSLQGIIGCPGWRDMPLSTRAILMTLLAAVLGEQDHIISISRKELGATAGISKPATITRAVEELQAIGLFQVEKGYSLHGVYKSSTYRLTWWSQSFQLWLERGYAVPPSAMVDTPTSQRAEYAIGEMQQLTSTCTTVPFGTPPPSPVISDDVKNATVQPVAAWTQRAP